MKALLTSILTIGLIGAASARADLIITLDQPDQTGTPGQTLSFTGIITNEDPDNAVNLNSVDINIAEPDLTGDAIDDFLGIDYPLSLDPGASSDDIELFTVAIANPLTDPVGTYTGTYLIKGGADIETLSTIGQIDFSVTDGDIGGDTPEPGSLTLLTGGLFGLGGLWMKRRAKSTSRA